MGRTTSSKWKIESKTDPRFNLEGRGETHALELPPAARSGITLLAEELGVDPPEDLEYVREKESVPPTPPDGVAYVANPSTFLVESGLLFELNRRVLHPLGLAIEITLPEEPGNESGEIRLWDCRKDPEGIIFSDAGFADGLAKFTQYMNSQGTRQLVSRRACIGFRVQGEID
jgi:hypothetical protein